MQTIGSANHRFRNVRYSCAKANSLSFFWQSSPSLVQSSVSPLSSETQSWCSGRGWGQQLFSFQSPAVHWMAWTSSLNCLSCRNPYQTPHSLNCLPPFHWKSLFSLKLASSHPLPKKSALRNSARKTAFWWGKEKTNKHKEFWGDTLWCVSRLSCGHVPSPSYVLSVPRTSCPLNLNFHTWATETRRPPFSSTTKRDARPQNEIGYKKNKARSASRTRSERDTNLHNLRPWRDKTGQHSRCTRLSLLEHRMSWNTLKTRYMPKNEIGMNLANLFPSPLTCRPKRPGVPGTSRVYPWDASGAFRAPNSFMLFSLIVFTCSFCHLDFVKEFPRFGRKISAKIG